MHRWNRGISKRYCLNDFSIYVKTENNDIEGS